MMPQATGAYYVTYAVPAPVAAGVPTRTNGYAIAALVLGILWIWGLGSLLAVVFGVIAKNQIDGSAGTQSGRGMAVAGIVLGIVGLVLLVIVIAALGASG